MKWLKRIGRKAADWAKELVTQPRMMAAFFAGVLIMLGVNPQAAHTIGAAAAEIGQTIEAQTADPASAVIIDHKSGAIERDGARRSLTTSAGQA